eukprot:CAMPEP_0197060700 /NCGR_PEP_ID=MMETSP1384-20130603/129596_1 /TAXON_ID=29189 /ORGANISM="Ammonia sp." /LENGTH=94 /DNA_ID=CAMNT_0042496097 /DNA_START=1 /DNA_END=281 /DNA_ORIENTATION=-
MVVALLVSESLAGKKYKNQECTKDDECVALHGAISCQCYCIMVTTVKKKPGSDEEQPMYKRKPILQCEAPKADNPKAGVKVKWGVKWTAGTCTS